jgi:hypothetical protein
VNRPQKITFGEMRQTGIRALLVYCSEYHAAGYREEAAAALGRA